MKPGQIVVVVVAVIALIVFMTLGGRILERVDADRIVVIQDPIDGDLHWHTTPGLKFQKFGKVTTYKKRYQYWFDAGNDEESDKTIRIRFNDGGTAKVSGSLSIANPLDVEQLVTDKIESAIQNVEDIDGISSTSQFGVSLIRVDFESGIDLDQSINDLKSAVDLAIPNLPEDQKYYGD